LNPLDFYLLAHLETFAYAAAVDNEATLHHRIVVCLSDNPQLPPGIFEGM
jgi:hypothetical protein